MTASSISMQILDIYERVKVDIKLYFSLRSA